MKEHSLFFDHVGYTKHQYEEGNIVLELTIHQDLLDEDGSIPSGVFTSMLDIVIGSTIGTMVDQPTTTVNLNATFFNLSNNGPFRSFASITYQDGKMITGEGTVVDQRDNIVAKGIGTFKVLSS